MNAPRSDMSGARSKKEEFASRLWRWRTQRGWSREEAAKLCVSHRTLQEWEQGRRRVCGAAAG